MAIAPSLFLGTLVQNLIALQYGEISFGDRILARLPKLLQHYYT